MEYKIFKETISDKELGEYDTYGVISGNIKIHDVSLIREEIEFLVNLLNRLNVSPIHFHEVAEDFIAEISSLFCDLKSQNISSLLCDKSSTVMNETDIFSKR